MKIVPWQLWWLLSYLSACSGDPWLIGCSYREWTPLAFRNLDLAECLRHCGVVGTGWARWKEPKDCQCVQILEPEELTEPQLDGLCVGLDEGRCHDDRVAGKAWSVYLVDGPGLSRVLVDIQPSTVLAGDSLTVRVDARLDWPASGGERNATGLHLFVTWKLDQRCVRREVAEVTDQQEVILAWTHKMYSPGQHLLGVVVGTGGGVVGAGRRVMVSPPIPSGLQLTLDRDTRDTPTCVPSHLPRGHVTIYTGRKARFVAALEIGFDPTFAWFVNDTERSETNSFPTCSGLRCRRSILEHTFDWEGVHRVSVNVSNQHGWVHQLISVVAVDYRLSDAVLRWRDGNRSTTDRPVTLLLTLLTTHHVATRLWLHWGDGTELNHTLQVGADAGDVTVRHDPRCHLSAEIVHSYLREGEYQPLARVDDGLTRIRIRSAEFLKVCHRLDHGMISGHGVAPSGSPVKLILHMNTLTVCQLTVDWRISEGSRVVSFVRNQGLNWSPKLRRPGTYHVEATAENAVGSVTFQHSLKIQDPIGGLEIRGSQSCYQTGVPFQLAAVYSVGSEVSCRWWVVPDSGWRRSDHRRDCRPTWTFYRAGNKTMNLEASNLVGRRRTDSELTVVEPVQGVYLSLGGPVSSKRVPEGQLVVLRGSHLNVTADGQRLSSVGRRRYLVKGGKASPGLTSLDLEISNPLGRHRMRVEVEVWRPFSAAQQPYVVLQSRTETSATYRAIFPDGSFSLEGALYRWKIPGGDPVYTSLPLVDLEWTGQVQLTVNNPVSSLDGRWSDDDRNLEGPQLVHPSVIQARSPTEFLLKNLPSGPYHRMEVSYVGRDSTQARTYIKETIGPTGQERWTHVFQRADLVTVHVVLSSDSVLVPDFNLTSHLSVQLPLTDIFVLGPREVPYLSRLPLFHSWYVGINSESNIGVVYAWKVDGEWKITAESKVTLALPRPGSHLLRVRAWNGINQLATSVVVSSIPVVSAVRLRVAPTYLGKYSELVITYNGSSTCNISVSFGDGSLESIRHSDSTGTRNGVFTVIVRHRYSRQGHYPVIVNVTNQVSWMTGRRVAEIGELIYGVVLTLLTPSPVPLTVEIGLVVVRATVASGTDLSFKWEFRDNDGDKYTSVESNRTSSLARHGYGIADTYNVSVEVSNRFSRVWAHLDDPVRVVEPIKQLRLHVADGIPAAPLLPDGTGSLSTPPIAFEAQAYWGSDIEFLFDFGDGNRTSVPARLGTLSLHPTARCTHSYQTEKAYKVKVTASNPLGNVSTTLPDLFYVQIPPKGLELNRKYYITVLGEPVVLKAAITAGTNVSYDWYLGDNDVYSDSGPEITLNFDKIGKYNISVHAYNRVTDLSPSIDRLFVSANIYVQEPLQEFIQSEISNKVYSRAIILSLLSGVEICIIVKNETICEGNNVDIPSDEEVTTIAHVLPSDEAALRFIWDLGIGELRKTNSPSISYNYREPGIYVVNVTALNHVSIVLSKHIVIHVIQKVGNLTSIRHHQSILVNRTAVFHAQYWFGTNLTFEWDFGDGNEKIITNSPKVQHTYMSVGEYWLIVHARNKYSEASLKTNVFVLRQHCQKPEVKFIDQSLRKEIRFSQDIVIEVDITTSCELSNNVIYLWKIFNNNQDEINMSEEILTQRQLIIPKEILPIGKYIIELKVKMKGTMVYTIEMTEIKIIPSEIIAFWEGGILRQVGHQDNVLINVISNINLEESNFSLNWLCTSFPFSDQQCFKNGSFNGMISSSYPSINFQVEALNPKLSAISFKLDVWHNNDLQTSSLQELEITDKAHMLPILIKRYNHFNHQVRQDSRLVFLAICKACRDIKLEFKWKLWLVQDGNHNLYISEHSCVQADGSTFYIHADNVTTTKPMKQTGHWTLESSNLTISRKEILEEEYPPFPKFPGLSEVEEQIVDTLNKRDREKRETFQELSNNSMRKEEFTVSPFLPFPPIEGDVIYETSHSHLPDDFPTDIISDSLYPFENFEEGNPGEGGSASAREQSLQQLEKTEEKILEEIGKGRYRTTGDSQFDDRGKSQFNVDKVRDGRYPSTAPHIVRRPRIPLSFKSNLVPPEYFIIEPGSLKIGSTYIVEVTATSKNKSELVGRALDFVVVNIGPTNGRCTLIPLIGEEFSTWFRLHCMEWVAKHFPLSYELHYTLTPNTSGHLVYFGFNGNAKFTLPAGLPQYNYSVYVDVIVRDSSGSSTKVCSIIRKVLPKWDDITDMKLFIINETTNSQSLFNKMLGEKNLQGLLHQIHVWATGLNHVYTESNKRKKRDIDQIHLRHKLINLISNLKLNSLMEVHQAFHTLLPLLKISSQISIKDLYTSFELIQKYYEKKNLHKNFPVKIFRESVLRITSQIIYSSILQLENTELVKDSTLKFLIENSIIIVRNIIKKNIVSLIPNDKPYYYETPHMDVFIGRMAINNPKPIIKFGKTEIILAHQMFLDLFNTSNDDIFSCRKDHPFICDCIEIMAESFTNSPYISNDNSIRTLGGTSSINFRSCKMHKPIETMNPNIEFHLNRLQMDSGKQYILPKEIIHIHRLNLTKDQINNSLVISLYIPDERSQNSFPLQLLFSYKDPPQPTKYLRKISSKFHEKIIKLFIPKYIMKEPGIYYLAILDEHFSKHSQQKIDISPITYILNVWLEKCIMWDKHHERWFSEGCFVLETTNINSVHCRCESINPISYITWNIVTDLQTVSVDKFLGSTTHLLPVIFAIAIYILLLLICHFSGVNDRKRTPLIDLKDNSHKCGYLMIIETGFYWNAGTTAMVCVVLHGENGMSETTSLVSRDSSHILFQRGSINTFYISTQSNLGNLWKLQIWHNNGGSSPSWYLKNITVFDMDTGNPYYFECEQWLSVEDDDGQIERELPINETPWKLSKIYQETFIRYLCDYHLWSSVYSKPPYSTFSRSQRLTCCFSLIMTSAAMIAVWYKFHHFEYYVEYGLLDSSWQTVTIGIISGFLVMLPHQFISSLFRNSHTSQITLLKCFQPLFFGWTWKSLYCSYQQKEANSTEASSESFSSSNSRSIYTADSLSHFEESIDSDDESSNNFMQREQFALMEGNNIDAYDSFINNQYRQHSSWDSYDDIGSSIEEDFYNMYKQRDFLSETNERIRNTRKKDIYQSEQTSSGFEDWPEKVTEDTSYEEYCHLNSIPLPLLTRMQRLVLPCWVQTLAWIFLLSNIVFCVFISMKYIYRFGDHYFNCWLQSLFYSIIASIFLLHPFWVFLLSIPVSIRLWILKDKSSFISSQINVSLLEEIIKVDYQLKNSPEFFGGEEEKLMKRQRARYLRYLRPPPEQTLIDARQKALKTRFIFKTIKNICKSVIVIILLIIIAFGNDTSHYYQQNISIQNAFLKTSKYSFNNVKSHKEWWNWIQNDFLDAFYGSESLTSWQRTEFEPLLSTGSIPIGEITVWHYQVNSQPCLELYQYFSFKKCFPDYSKYSRYKKGNETSFNHQLSKSVWGRHGQYNGDGHAIILGKTRKNAYDQLLQLYNTNLLDNSSRALIVEFLLYNPALSLYIPVSIITEFSAAGIVDKSFSALPCRLYYYSTKMDTIIFASQFIFLILVLWMLKKEIWKMWKIRHIYWLSPWNYLQVAFFFLSLSYLSCNMYRSVLVTIAIQNHQSSDLFFYISKVAYWDQVLNGQLGLLIFIHAINCLKLLNISTQTKQFLQVFRFVQKEIITSVFLVLVLLIGFAHIGNLAFGSNEFSFRNPILQSFQMIRLVLRQSAVTRYPNTLSFQAEVYAMAILFGILGWLAIGMALIKAIIIRSKYHIHRRKENGIKAREAAQLILQSLGMSKKDKKDAQCKEKSSPPAELLLMELETLVDDIFVYANKLFSDVEVDEDCKEDELEIKPIETLQLENSIDCHQVIAELHHQSVDDHSDYSQEKEQ